MWKVKQIFDGEYGCEECLPGEKMKCLVTIEDEQGNVKSFTAEDEWLTNNHIDEGSIIEEGEFKNEICNTTCNKRKM